MIYVFICLCVLLVGCNAVGESAIPTETPSRIVYGLTLSPSGFDPHRNESAELGIVMRQVYDTLVYRDPTNGNFVAGLATEWTVSDDRLTYTFKLREGVRFHDNTIFDAIAVGATLDRITNPDTRSSRALTLLGPYNGYEIIDRYTIAINLSEPFSPLLDSLSQVYLGIASPTQLARYSVERYQYYQAGTGPYKLVSYVPDDHLILERNPDYAWGPAFYQPAEIDVIEYRFYTTPATRFTALESDDVQIIGEIPPLTARTETGNSQIQIMPTAIPGQPLQYLINTQQFPTDNLTFRQALLFGTNRRGIVDAVFQGFSPVAWGPITSNTLYYSRAVEERYAYDSTQARALLASIGYVDADSNGFLDHEGGDLQLRVIMPTWGSIPDVTQLIQEQWRDLGIRVVIETVPDAPTLFAQVQEGNYNLVAFHTFGLDPAFLNSYFVTNGSRNWSRFSDATLDQILRDAVRQLEPGTRNNLYTQAQQIIMDNALILPIREYVNLNTTSIRIEGLQFDPYGWFPLMANVRLRS